jgi:hypothetical protein
VEVTADGQVVWEWFGAEHGYVTRPEGTVAFFDRSADYRPMRRATAEQAMHVTSAILLPNNTVLATLFHQGQLISIDQRTGDVTLRLDGLSKPHAIHRRHGGFMLSDTLGHRILLIDDELNICSEIACGFQWLQEAICTSAGTYFVLENVHIDQLPDSDLNNRLTEIDGAGTQLVSLEVASDYRLFAACEVSEALARELALVWGNTGDFNFLTPSRRVVESCSRSGGEEKRDAFV